jgi:predicted molibdopterin-dependent oxidoreductase YjgC
VTVKDEMARAACGLAWLGRWVEPQLGARRIESLPAEPGLRLPELWTAVSEGRVKAMYIVGDDPALADPGAAAALAQLELLVVQETFLSETAQLAEVVLPDLTAAEKNGTFTSNDRHIQRLKPALSPVGRSRPGDEIIRGLAARLGYRCELEDPAAILAEIARLVPSYHGVSAERLERGGVQWPVTSTEHSGTPYLFGERFATPSGRAVFGRVALTLPVASSALTLTVGDSLYQWRTGVVSQHSRPLRRLEGDPRVEINPSDAERLGVADGRWVRLTTAHGALRARAMVTPATTPGVLYMDAQSAVAPTALLTAPAGALSGRAVAVGLALEEESGGASSLLHAGTGRSGVL